MRIEDYGYGRIVIDGREERRDVALTPSARHTHAGDSHVALSAQDVWAIAAG